ncbi:MAG: CbbX protein [Ktedonobacteraceae bacterium]|nr:CbbX protein [Ktedonobacteraceae bacterium]
MIPPAQAGAPENTGQPVLNTPTEETSVDVSHLLEESQILEVLRKLDEDLVGLKAIKTRIREIASLLLIERMRRSLGLTSRPPSLHMSFTGPPGTGKTTVALRMATILHRLDYVRKGHLVAVTRDDLVGQYIGHTAPKTKEVLKRAMGGVLFIDEAYYLYRQENERDYGQEAIEILLQVMENQRDDLVVILAGYKDRMETFFQANPGFSSRIAHHLDFPDYTLEELLIIAQLMLAEQMYRFSPEACQAFEAYLKKRMQMPRFANARSVRNALDRARLRQANRLIARGGRVSRTDLMTIEAEDILASRVFTEATTDDEQQDALQAPGSSSTGDPASPA